ncbi:MAG: hypoxanthine phosphoribosyltransferase [Thermoanaerobaculia bacterium]|nr:hypoxanthine phosphoribosyltransferase [Thermoanaerobaculia bacterium]
MPDDATEPAEVLLSEEAISERVDELAAEIDRDYADVEELFMVGVLRGAFIFLADLARRLTIPRRVDFIAVASYEEGERALGDVRLIMDVRSSIEGKHVLIVEDIVDTGHTMQFLQSTFAARHPASCRACALVRKRAAHEVPVDLDYQGFDIPDLWVVGYGLDYDDRYRTLPYIARFEP